MEYQEEYTFFVFRDFRIETPIKREIRGCIPSIKGKPFFFIPYIFRGEFFDFFSAVYPFFGNHRFAVIKRYLIVPLRTRRYDT